jgi:hypothetical protein
LLFAGASAESAPPHSKKIMLTQSAAANRRNAGGFAVFIFLRPIFLPKTPARESHGRKIERRKMKKR